MREMLDRIGEVRVPGGTGVRVVTGRRYELSFVRLDNLLGPASYGVRLSADEAREVAGMLEKAATLAGGPQASEASQ